jgi:hypothetical protein
MVAVSMPKPGNLIIWTHNIVDLVLSVTVINSDQIDLLLYNVNSCVIDFYPDFDSNLTSEKNGCWILHR